MHVLLNITMQIIRIYLHNGQNIFKNTQFYGVPTGKSPSTPKEMLKWHMQVDSCN